MNVVKAIVVDDSFFPQILIVETLRSRKCEVIGEIVFQKGAGSWI
jgi:hypothetical protein